MGHTSVFNANTKEEYEDHSHMPMPFMAQQEHYFNGISNSKPMSVGKSGSGPKPAKDAEPIVTATSFSSASSALSPAAPALGPDGDEATSDHKSFKDLAAEDFADQGSLATQMWRMYAKQKAQLPQGARMENLSWRMMSMSLRRQEHDRRYGEQILAF